MKDNSIICSVCSNDHPTMVVLVGSKDGLPTVACELCAGSRAAFCDRHQLPRMVFLDGTMACTECVQEMADANEGDAEEIAGRLRVAIEDWFDNLICERAELLNDRLGLEDLNLAVVYLIAFFAVRTNRSLEQALASIEEMSRLPADFLG